MKLHHCAGSRGLRALWTIEEMGLDCELARLPFPPRHAAPEYLQINPLGTIPALQDGDYLLTESSAIAHYLATKYGPSLLAVAAHEPDYAPYLDFLHHADATLTFPQTVYLRFAVFEPARGLQEAGQAYATWFAKRLIKAEQRLQTRDYLAANRFTAADIAVAYALFLATNIGLGEHIPPTLSAYLTRQTARPAFQRALAREAA